MWGFAALCCQHHCTSNVCSSWRMGKAIWRTCAGQSSLLRCKKNHCVNTLIVKCLHSGPQSYTVGQQWDVLPVKIAPVATSKSAICHSFCPYYKQRTSQARINIVTDLGNNSMPDISKQVAAAVVVGVTFAHQSPRHYEWGGGGEAYVINPGRRLLNTSLYGWACGWFILLCTRSLVFLGCTVPLPAEQHLTTQKAAPMNRKWKCALRRIISSTCPSMLSSHGVADKPPNYQTKVN